MPKKLFLAIIGLFFLICCNGSLTLMIPTYPITAKNAKLVFNDDMVLGTTSYGCPSISGTIKNIGETTAEIVSVSFTAYKNGIIVDGAWDGLPDIPVNTSAKYTVIFYNLTSHADYDIIYKTNDFISMD